ncbi:MAG: tetratricopeptide repeat protein [Sphingobacteriales bacterium]|nr:MAG: tetratricopeptide repeat protein [Sphingobacteriales bacterium]
MGLLGLLVLCFLSVPLRAQTNRAAIDSARKAVQVRTDSMRVARNEAIKILRDAQKQRTDSLASLRKYRESKRFTDSVAKVRQARTESSRAVQRTRIDSATAIRNASRDSMTAARNSSIAEMRTAQKARTDSLAARRNYRESKRYSDSVAVVRKSRADSLSLARKAYADSAKTSRKAISESLTATRKKTADSLTAIRKKTSDSLTAIRKVRTDSLTAIRTAKEKANKEKQKAREKKMDLSLTLKMSKKREKWSNESMLKKRWGVPRKQLQNLFTHYNYYFNANRKMEEAEANMLRAKKDNYDSLIALFPFNPDTDSTLLLADMDSIVQKASVGIQIHDPRTDWADELYLLLGQAYYYKGNYDNASTAFRYVISLRELKRKEEARKKGTTTSTRGKTPSILEADKKGTLDFLKHQSVHNDALLWLARTYAQTGRYGEAESVLDLLINDPNFPESLRGRYALEAANLALHLQNYKNATAPLLAVADDKKMPNWQRQRAAYLGGQLLYREGKYLEAAKAFETVADLNPKIDLDFQARKNQAYSIMASGTASEATVASLRKLLKDSKYAPYYEQVYYVLGKIAANSGNNALAIDYLNQSIRTTKTSRSQKALSFLTLGDVYYASGDYSPAQAAYDSAAYLAGKAGSGKPPFDVAVQRAKSLSAVAGPARMVYVQDSLLSLSNLSEKEQRAVVRKYLKTLAAQQSDSLLRAAGDNGSVAALPDNAGDPSADNSWYFASTATLQQGYNDFRRKWGNRPLADNWRRAGASGTSLAGNNPDGTPLNPAANGDAVVNSGGGQTGNGLPSEASLLALIPKTEAERQAVRDRLEKGMLALATAYTKDIQDYPRAVKTLDDLDRRFPGHPDQEEALYLGYLIYLRQNQIERAQMLSQQLLEKYPQSQYASLVRPSDDAAGPLLTSTVEASTYYAETYNLVQQRSFVDALRRSRDGQQRWSDPRTSDRFRILEIMALAGTNEYGKADSMVNRFLTSTANDSLRSWAQTLQTFIRQRKAQDSVQATASAVPVPSGNAVAPGNSTPAAPGTVAAGTPTNPVVPATTTTPALSPATRVPANAPAIATVPATYVYQPNAPHVFAFAYGQMAQRIMGLKAGMGDLNTLQFGADSLQTQIQNLPGGKGLILVKGFKNAQQAKGYERTFKNTVSLMREFPAAERKTLLLSETNLLKLVADGNLAAYETFYRKNYK